MSHYSLLDPVVPPQVRSNLRQGLLRFARGLDWANAGYRNFDAPIVLIGSARGGTTLLANLVGAHPRVMIFHERFTIGKESYRDTFGVTQGTEELARAFIRYIPHRVKRDNSRWGIKICTYHWTRDDLNRFLETFRRTQVVFVVRDGRDVILSMLKRSKLFKSADQCARRWLESMEVFDFMRGKLSGQMFWFHYEDLVRDPDNKMREICQFIGEPFNQGMLDPRTWPRVGSYEIAPVSAEKVGKWRDHPIPELPAELRERLETTLMRLGYGDA
jgi:hypothetical protein